MKNFQVVHKRGKNIVKRIDTYQVKDGVVVNVIYKEDKK